MFAYPQLPVSDWYDGMSRPRLGLMVAATLSDVAELHARLHDLSVVALRTRGRQRVLLASVPTSAGWAGPAAVAYTTHRLTVRAAALGLLADALDAVAGQLTGVVAAVAPLRASRVEAGSSPASVRAAQRLLAAAGAAPGSIDGVWGASTAASVARVQGTAGLSATGVVDAATALALSAAAAGGAVTIGAAPGVPHGLQPLAGSHPVVAVAPPAVAAPAPADPTSADDPTAGPTASGDPTASSDPTAPADPTSTGDPTAPDDPTAADDPTSTGDPTAPDDPGPDTEGDDPGPSDSPALRQLLGQLGRSPAPVPFS